MYIHVYIFIAGLKKETRKQQVLSCGNYCTIACFIMYYIMLSALFCLNICEFKGHIKEEYFWWLFWVNFSYFLIKAYFVVTH